MARVNEPHVQAYIRPVLINISNHPVLGWSEEQKKGYKIIDVPFPAIDPCASAESIRDSAFKLAAELNDKYLTNETFFVAGEFSFSFHMVAKLHALGRTVVQATTERIVEELADGTRNVAFQFRQWRII